MKKKKNESGEMMLEASIILSFTLIALICLIGAGFYIYQQATAYAIANETANDVAKNYKYMNKISEINTDVIPVEKMYGLKKYRMYISLSDLNKTKRFVAKQADLTSFDGAQATEDTKVEIMNDNIGRKKVKVTVVMDCNILFEGALNAIGLIDDDPKFTAVSYAECMDLTEYVSQVHFVNYVGDLANDSALGEIYNNFMESKDTIKSIIRKLKS